MNRIVKILMQRDEMSKEEAQELLQETRDAMMAAIDAGDFFEVEDIMADYLGLEPDYIFDII